MRALIRGLVALTTAWLLTSAADTAWAGPVKALSSYANPGGTNYTLGFVLNGTNKGFARSTTIGGNFTTQIWDGVPVMGPPSSQLRTFCVDLLHNLAGPPPRDANTSFTSGHDSQTTTDGIVLDRNLGAAAWFAKNINAADSIQRAGLQLAIWEALYDNDGNLDGGLFKVTSIDANVRAAAQNYLNQALSAGGGSFATANGFYIKFVNGGSQDQITFIVPEPVSLAMVAIAGLSLAGYRRIQSRRTRLTA